MSWERAVLPQPEHARLQGRKREQGRDAWPQPGRGRIGAAEQAVGHGQELAGLGVVAFQANPRSHAASLLD
jgi:hypothetical protein